MVDCRRACLRNFFETDGVVVGQVKRRPLRVLCLHGGGSNNKVTEGVREGVREDVREGVREDVSWVLKQMYELQKLWLYYWLC